MLPKAIGALEAPALSVLVGQFGSPVSRSDDEVPR